MMLTEPQDRSWRHGQWSSMMAQFKHHSVGDPTMSADTITTAARDVLAERARQQTVEGYTPEGDDRYRDGELAAAAACYLAYHSLPPSAVLVGADLLACAWPWAPSHWKPKTAREDLVKAGALILAEIERLDRDNDDDRNEPDAAEASSDLVRPFRDLCVSRCEDFRFILHVFEAEMPPGLDLWWDEGTAWDPVSLSVDRAGDATIHWRDHAPTDIGGMPKAVLEAIRHHGRISVATGSTEAPRGRVLLLPTNFSNQDQVPAACRSSG